MVERNFMVFMNGLPSVGEKNNERVLVVEFAANISTLSNTVEQMGIRALY